MNHRHRDFQSRALPTELPVREVEGWGGVEPHILKAAGLQPTDGFAIPSNPNPVIPKTPNAKTPSGQRAGGGSQQRIDLELDAPLPAVKKQVEVVQGRHALVLLSVGSARKGELADLPDRRTRQYEHRPVELELGALILSGRIDEAVTLEDGTAVLET